ncbi:NupC/NupG family nucleoside CNT transporter [Dellaglioa algida]|uniref:Nucleoside transporter n=1 Tax=Dellaglioa algida TaxID=105612 RepID=A0A5C6MDK2_9LACO|nr:nucleoside transporter C-terminal domain-containing protein [Dellaglioa algida]MDK1717228.1 NupC/NupG family nucleoside CNT transporter [Dellaglioa algida]MDK1720423.1 NupC/NupG family nucleoside CNT transporter [Dellaglioa algida]MDK1722170.1 NupC/NupG family nucleoside CNT transporter [Dellaglioa algida]MDK1723712.1 NupC/NupG family nucleoside CNT transporter [Dellaglioa algida]MDK1725293.1 NupC/NupG family nucleoside CNT transporter [Dellaglioa algida]
MYLLVNILGVAIFILVALAFSKKKREINWRSIAIMVVINLFLAWFLTEFSLGRNMVEGAANGFNWLMSAAYQGIQFMVPAMPKVTELGFFMSVLLPVIMIVPLFDILTYIGILPWIIKWIGHGLSKITGQPKFESFFAVEMMFLGNTEALAVSSLQLKLMKSERNLTLAMMSMSCVTASIIGAYTTMMPGQYILTAIPINIINAIIITSILNPVKVTAEEDTIAEMTGSNSNDLEVSESDGKKEPFFAFLGDSILGAGKLVLIIAANVIAFVALAALIDNILGLANPNLSLENILGVIMFPFAWLMGFNPSDAFELARYMGTKLVTNEFVVMGQVSSTINSFAPHYKAVLTVFVTSFANFSTIGMIIGCFKGIVNKEKNDVIARNVGYMLLSGILVSLLSAGMVGIFVW